MTPTDRNAHIFVYFTVVYELMTLYVGREKCNRLNRNDNSRECGSWKEAVGENINTVNNNAEMKNVCPY
jgi:hypothetical protein